MGEARRGLGDLTSSGEKCIETLSQLSLRVGQEGVNPQWILVDAVTAVEVHVDRAVDALVSASGVAESFLGRALLASVSDEMSRSWPSRYEWLNSGFGIKLKGGKVEQDFDAAIECRNAIVHGSGKLTKRQQSNFSKLIQLRRRLESVLDVGVYGVDLVVSAKSAKKALFVSQNYVFAFDREVLDCERLDF